jgi:hypothetical protein
MTTTEVSNTEEAATTFKAGSWQETLAKSAALQDRVKKGSARASALLWEGAQEAINQWVPKSERDENGEKLGAAVTEALGKSRKGDASKIKTVALAVKNNGLVLSQHSNLSKAYAEATRLTKTVKVHIAEDEAADEAVSAIAAPKSTSSPEGAAKIVLSKGVDEAARLLLNELGAENIAAHRAFMRAISQEIVGRIPKPAPKPPKKAAPKKGAKAAKKAAPKKAAPKAASTKAKPVAVKSAPAKAKPVVASTKAKPVAVKA